MELLVIGWDAATEQHLSQFDLPFWESLSNSGQLLPEHPFDDAGYISSANAWTTISTGASFFDHGILGFVYGEYSGHPFASFVQRLATQQQLPPLARRILIGRVLGQLGAGEKGEKGEKVDSSNIDYKRVWEYLDGKALIYGLPLTYPTPKRNAVVVSGIPAPKPDEATNPVVYPTEFEDFVYDESEAGYYVEMNSPVNDNSVKERPYCVKHQERMKNNARKYQELYEQMNDDIEFGFLMLRGLDDIMHATLDEDIIRESYHLIDEITRELVDNIDPEAVLVLSDHGMRPASDLRFDKDMRMDHDTKQGVWGATESFELDRHTDVTPEILDYYDIQDTVPQKRRKDEDRISSTDEKVIHERLEDLGYA